MNKTTDRQSFPHHKSYHPSSTKKSAPFSQALRLSRICSDGTDYLNQLEELKLKFTQRGYPSTEITTQFNKATNIDRKESLIYKASTLAVKNPLYTRPQTLAVKNPLYTRPRTLAVKNPLYTRPRTLAVKNPLYTRPQHWLERIPCIQGLEYLS